MLEFEIEELFEIPRVLYTVKINEKIVSVPGTHHRSLVTTANLHIALTFGK